MSKSTWADVVKGDAVELNGRVWTVTKIKPKGKKAAVKLERKGRTSSGEVRLADRVKILAAGGAVKAPKRAPLHDAAGAQNRWATGRELADVIGRGDPAQRKPPAKAKGDDWQGKKAGAEKTLEKALGARLVGEEHASGSGYYVPPVDVSTVAAHLALFHAGIPEACNDDEGRMLEVHARQHLAASKGEGVLAVNHWHTEKRP